jgi:hypothetical protein
MSIVVGHQDGPKMETASVRVSPREQRESRDGTIILLREGLWGNGPPKTWREVAARVDVSFSFARKRYLFLLKHKPNLVAKVRRRGEY